MYETSQKSINIKNPTIILSFLYICIALPSQKKKKNSPLPFFMSNKKLKEMVEHKQNSTF